MTDDPKLSHDENNENSLPPSHGVESGPDGIPKGVDTAPEASPDDPEVPGQPKNPDEVAGIG